MNDLSWLGGILDGEGCFYVKRRTNVKNALNTWVEVGNTNFKIIQKATSTIRVMGIQLVPTVRECRSGRKFWMIRVYGRGALLQFLPRIIPHLVGKRDEAELMLAIAEAGPFYGGVPVDIQGLAEEVARLKTTSREMLSEPLVGACRDLTRDA